MVTCPPRDPIGLRGGLLFGVVGGPDGPPSGRRSHERAGPGPRRRPRRTSRRCATRTADRPGHPEHPKSKGTPDGESSGRVREVPGLRDPFRSGTRPTPLGDAPGRAQGWASADSSRRDLLSPERRRPTTHGISRPPPGAARPRADGARRPGSSPRPRRPSSGPITHDTRPSGEGRPRPGRPGRPDPARQPPPRRPAPRPRPSRRGRRAGPRRRRPSPSGSALTIALTWAAASHAAEPVEGESIREVRIVGQHHGQDRDDPRQDPQPEGPPPQPRPARRRPQGARGDQALRRRPLRGRARPGGQGGDPDLQGRRDAGADERRVHRPQGDLPQEGRGDDRPEEGGPRELTQRPAGRQADQGALRGEGVRAGRGQADQGGRPRRPRGHHQHLRRAEVPHGGDRLRRQHLRHRRRAPDEGPEHEAPLRPRLRRGPLRAGRLRSRRREAPASITTPTASSSPPSSRPSARATTSAAAT